MYEFDYTGNGSSAALRKAGEKVAPLEIALHQRFAIPVAALLFVVMGVPLALAGAVPSWLAGWGPNIVFAGAAAAVYAWVAHR